MTTPKAGMTLPGTARWMLLVDAASARFWAKVDRRTFFDCWEWTAARHPFGYGAFQIGGGVERAHRIAYELTYGPLPPHVVIRHSCDNPPCVNPAHLLIGTHADNVHDKVARGRQAQGEHNGRARLTADDVRAIRRRATEKPSDLAREFGVSRRAIDYIVQGVNWKHVQ